MATNDVKFQIDVPQDQEAGVPADFASLWHTSTSFVIDFVAATKPAQVTTDESGAQRRVVPGQVVSRVRIPPQQVFELARALTQQLDAWERETGRKSDGSE
ncbi:DUF3467 domain-containing protein [Isoptericola sp. BMS4]|uniref:DUF3467 domain-containing protein n=1 Tax=Isoptericola sp. BMS4 TaxID=2527875 RepID=UPI001423B30C|nr:DUF3467 domain-containing protein [Isoptericola sp. BMS4]